MKSKKRNIIQHILIKIAFVLMVNILVFILSLQFPYVQTKIAQFATLRLQEASGIKVNIERIEIDWLDKATMHNVQIFDNNDSILISADDISIDYEIFSILKKGHHNIDFVRVTNPRVNIIQHDSLSPININEFISRIRELSKKEKNKAAPIVLINEAEIESGRFGFNINHKAPIKSSFDHNHFDLLSVSVSAKNLLFHADTFKAEINKLSCIDKVTGLEIHNLSTDYMFTNQSMTMGQLNLKIGTSHITDSIAFKYNRSKDLSYFNDSVYVYGNFNNASINSADLAVFAPYFSSIKDQYKLSGTIRGKVTDFRVNKLDLKFGKGSVMKGNLLFEGLPIVFDTFMDISLNKSTFIENDLTQYINLPTFEEYNRFDHVGFSAGFTGYLLDFVAKGEFNTNLGYIKTDINLKIGEDTPSYSGTIHTLDFELGKYALSDDIGQITMTGSVKGQGFDPSHATFQLDGDVHKIDILDYQYVNINTDGVFSNNYFNGYLSIDDPAIKFSADGIIDIRNGKQLLKADGLLEYAFLDSLNFLNEKSTVRSKLKVDIDGFNLDSLTGIIGFKDFEFVYKNDSLKIDSLNYVSKKSKLDRNIRLISNRVSVDLTGDFNPSQVYDDVKKLLYEYKLNLKNNRKEIEEYYISKKPDSTLDYSLSFDIGLNDINPLLHLFIPNLYVSKNTQISGEFRHGYTSIFSCIVNNDSIYYNNNSYMGNEISMNFSKIADSVNVLGSFDIISAKQLIQKNTHFENLMLTTIWDKSIIDFNLFASQQKLNNIFDLYGQVEFLSDSTRIHITPSNLRVLNKTWLVSEQNQILLLDDQVKIDNLNFRNNDEMIGAHGYLSNDSTRNLYINLKNFDINIFNPFIKKSVSGISNGNAVISNYFDSPKIESSFFVESFSVNEFPIGNLSNSSQWQKDKDLFDIKFQVEKDDKQIITIDGTFDPKEEENKLNLDAKIRNADLSIAEPFLSYLFSDISGSTTGDFRITGSILRPKLNGSGKIDQGKLTADYLKTVYDCTGDWVLSDNSIKLENFLVTDSDNNEARLVGEFRHNWFKDFVIDLHADLDNFKVLNTTAKDNNLYYGIGKATGTIDFSGPVTNIFIKARAVTNKGTKFYIPLTSSSGFQTEEFITFTSFRNEVVSDIVKEKTEDLKISGITLDFDMEITPEAYSEIIFDLTAGDIIRGRGEGNLNLQIDTKGEFNMFGEYTFAEGGYNFTMYNIVNKEFVIEPESRIVWGGDPYAGRMEINATYDLLTSLIPLVDTTLHNRNDVKRKYPSKVLLNLTDELMSPEIAFKVLLDDYPKSDPDIDTQVKAFINKLENDEQELNKQVFSLLVLRKFSPPNSYDTGGTLGSSVSEFISNQLSYWISQVDENLEIDIDLGDLDRDALNTFQLRLSYQFLDGRLRVTRDGGFANASNKTDISSIAGDWIIEYLLSQDGKFRMKMYRKTNYDQISTATGDNTSLVTGGFSLLYTTSFNTLQNLFKKKNKEKNNKNKSVKNINEVGILPEDKLESLESNNL